MRAPCSWRIATRSLEWPAGTLSTDVELGTQRLPCAPLAPVKAIYFDTLAVPEPASPWHCGLGDLGILYGPGEWPFYRSDRLRVLRRREAAAIRIDPHCEYRMWRNPEVRLYRQPAHHPVRVRLTLWVRAHEGGGWVLPAEALLWVPTRTWVWQTAVPEHLGVTAANARDRILHFLDIALSERDAGAIAPQTAHSRWAFDVAATTRTHGPSVTQHSGHYETEGQGRTGDARYRARHSREDTVQFDSTRLEEHCHGRSHLRSIWPGA